MTCLQYMYYTVIRIISCGLKRNNILKISILFLSNLNLYKVFLISSWLYCIWLGSLTSCMSLFQQKNILYLLYLYLAHCPSKISMGE